MVILLRLIVAHLLADFLFQTTAWVEDKRAKKLKSVYFYFHGLIHFITNYLFLAMWDQWLIPLIIAFTHLIIDYWKLSVKEKTRYFLADQLLHIIILVISWSYLTHS